MNQRSAGDFFTPMTVTNLSGPRPSTGSAASFALPFGAPPLPAASAEAILRRGTRCVRTSDSVPMQLSDTNAIIARFCLSVNDLYYFLMKMRQDAPRIFVFWLTRMKRSVAALR